MKLSLIRNITLAGVVSFGLLSSAMVSAQPIRQDFSDSQKAQIEKIIHDYLLKNPTVLIEVNQALQETALKDMVTQAKSAVQKNASKIFESPSPMLGNPKGDVTLVEFFDYQCMHCQEAAPVVNKLISNNKNLRVVLKQFPIFGESSEYAAKAALAAAKQGKFVEMHEALMTNKQELSKPVVMKIAQSVGLNPDQLATDINSEEINNQLKASMKLADVLRFRSTPIFIIVQTPKGTYKGGKTVFVPGAVGEKIIQGYIKQVQG